MALECNGVHDKGWNIATTKQQKLYYLTVIGVKLNIHYPDIVLIGDIIVWMWHNKPTLSVTFITMECNGVYRQRMKYNY